MNDMEELNTDLRVRVSEERRRQVEILADKRSSPGDRVTVSDILRDALGTYLDDEAQTD